MDQTITGTIVMFRVEQSEGSDYKKGFVTVLTPHGEYFTLDVDAYTSSDTLEEGACVTAHISRSDSSHDWIVSEIVRLTITERPCNC